MDDFENKTPEMQEPASSEDNIPETPETAETIPAEPTVSDEPAAPVEPTVTPEPTVSDAPTAEPLPNAEQAPEAQPIPNVNIPPQRSRSAYRLLSPAAAVSALPVQHAVKRPAVRKPAVWLCKLQHPAAAGAVPAALRTRCLSPAVPAEYAKSVSASRAAKKENAARVAHPHHRHVRPRRRLRHRLCFLRHLRRREPRLRRHNAAGRSAHPELPA